MCHCHNQEENTNCHLLMRENWAGWSRDNQKPPSSKSSVDYNVQEHSCQCSQSSVFCNNMSWEAAVQERSSWSRRNTLKLDWSLLLITRTKKNTFWRKTLWSHETKTELFDYNEQKYVWREVEAFNSKNTIPAVRHGAGSIMLSGCCAASGPGAFRESKWNYEEVGLSPNSPGKPQIISRRSGLGCSWVFQQDNDPKHTSNDLLNEWMDKSAKDRGFGMVFL